MPDQQDISKIETYYTGPIIDAHFHVWDLDNNIYPWLLPEAKIQHRYGNYDQIKHNYLPEDYQRDIQGHNITCGIYMEAEWDPNDPIGEMTYISKLAEKYNFFGAMVAQAWLDSPTINMLLERQSSFPLVRSIRHKPGGAKSQLEAQSGVRSLMSDSKWRDGYSLLSKYGLHFELQTPWWNLHEAAILAKDYPDTLMIINHSGVILNREPETIHAWQQALEQIAACPNVFIKASGLCVENELFTKESNQPLIETMINIFGAHRVMFGSNFPVDGLFGDYNQLIKTYQAMVSHLSDDDQHHFFFKTASNVYRPREPDYQA